MSVDNRRGGQSLDELRANGYVVSGQYNVKEVVEADSDGQRTVQVDSVHLHEQNAAGDWEVSTVLKPKGRH